MRFQYVMYSDSNLPVRTASRSGKGELVAPHYHEALELIFVQKGSISALVNGKSFECDTNDILLIPGGSVHRGSSDSNDTLIFSIFFPTALLDHPLPPITLEEHLNQELAFSYVLKSDNAANEFLRVYRKCNEKSLHTGDVMQIISGLYAIIGEYMSSMPDDGRIQSYNRLSPVIDYIKENLHRPIRIRELSAILYVCDDHLIRLFKHSTHKTPSRYIMDLRIERAMHLLCTTELSLAQIADKVGFSNGGFMTKVFKEKFHILPSEYRKRERKC